MASTGIVHESAGDVLDRAALLEHFEGDEEFAREVAELFVADCPRRLAALHEALLRRDCEGLRDAAHSIKGSVANFGAASAVGAAQHVEAMARAGDLSDAAEACGVLEHEISRVRQALAALL